MTKKNKSEASTSSKDVNAYLAAIPEDKRATLQKLRRIIKSAAPEAVEVISYQIPVFKYKGRLLVGFGAAKNHCALYGMSYILKMHKKELKSYDTSKGTIRFPAEKPLPAALVKKLVKARIGEMEAAQKSKEKKT